MMFSGRFVDSKMPDFFCEVVLKVKNKKPEVNILLLGDGPLRMETLARLKENNINFESPGFVSQNELPAYYCNARIFLFPTKTECWGVVLNEACAAGMAVMTCDNTAAAGELVVHNVNGYVLPLNSELWAEHALSLLENKDALRSFSDNSVKLVSNYTYSNSAQGIAAAVQYADNL
jgi:glycosyltransferase involved in cell wall biosynthesis